MPQALENTIRQLMSNICSPYTQQYSMFRKDGYHLVTTDTACEEKGSNSDAD